MSLKDLLRNLANGDYDGGRIDNEENGVSWGFYIDKGTPVKYREGKSSIFFSGKENERIAGTRTEERFDADEKKDLYEKIRKSTKDIKTGAFSHVEMIVKLESR